jgi:hypothetical protein
MKCRTTRSICDSRHWIPSVCYWATLLLWVELHCLLLTLPLSQVILAFSRKRCREPTSSGVFNWHQSFLTSHPLSLSYIWCSPATHNPQCTERCTVVILTSRIVYICQLSLFLISDSDRKGRWRRGVLQPCRRRLSTHTCIWESCLSRATRKSFHLHLQSRFKGNLTSFDGQRWFVSVFLVVYHGLGGKEKWSSCHFMYFGHYHSYQYIAQSRAQVIKFKIYNYPGQRP